MALALAGTPAAADPPLPPIEPGADDGGFDWVQHESGEWLRGELTRMQDETLYFDSEEFDEQALEWDDVSSLISAGHHSFRIEGRDPVRGNFEMRNRTLYIDTGTEVLVVERERVLALIPGEGRELDFWWFEASLGLTAQAGNTEQTDLSVSGEARRESPLTRWVTSYRGNFHANEGVTTAENHRLPSKFDYFVTSRLFLRVASLEYYRDEFQNIQTRLTAGSGVGYRVIDTKRVEWEVATGAGYQLTRYESVEPGDAHSEHDAAALFGTELNFDLPRGSEWDNSYVVALVATDLGKTSHHAESVFDFDIWGPLDLEVTFTFDRIEKPRPESGGERPESNDYRLIVGLGVEF